MKVYLIIILSIATMLNSANTIENISETKVHCFKNGYALITRHIPLEVQNTKPASSSSSTSSSSTQSTTRMLEIVDIPDNIVDGTLFA